MANLMKGVRWERREVDNSCKGRCAENFNKSGFGYSAFDPSLGKYPEVSLMELSRRCEMRCDDPNIQFGSSSPLKSYVNNMPSDGDDIEVQKYIRDITRFLPDEMGYDPDSFFAL